MKEYKLKYYLLYIFFSISMPLFSQNRLMEIQYTNFDKAVVIDIGFEKYVSVMNHFANLYNLELLVQDSFRVQGENIPNAIVIPIEKSNHYVGHAIDINILYKNILYNSKKLKKFDELPDEISHFLNACKSNGIRWGGDLSVHDVVHFDGNLYESNTVLYGYLLEKYQTKNK